MHPIFNSLTYYLCCIQIPIWGLTAVHAEPILQTYQESPIAVVNQVYPITFELSWTGDPAQYASVPPNLELTDWGDISQISTSTGFEGGKNVIRHTVSILPKETGTFTIPEVSISYYVPADLPDEDENGETPVYTYPTLQASVLSITVREPTDYMLNTVMILGLGTVLFTCAFVFQRRNAVRIARASDYLEMTVPSMIHDAKKHRLDQDYYAFFQGLLRGAGLLKNAATRDRLQKKLEELTLSTGYKGTVPSDAQMDEVLGELQSAYQKDGRETSS